MIDQKYINSSSIKNLFHLKFLIFCCDNFKKLKKIQTMANLSSNTTIINFTTLLSSTSNETTISTPSLDELLDDLGYEMWESVISTFILPPINIIGILLCSFSLWIFSRSSFKDPIFFYYKLLCFVYIIHLLHNISYCVLFSPRYFPTINTYWTSVYQIYSTCVFIFLFHFEDVLQMGILLHKNEIVQPICS